MMPMRIRRKGRTIEKLENPTALQRRGRSFSYDATNQITLASPCERVTFNVSWPSVSRRSEAAKLLRGHALRDMSDLNGKVAVYCRKSRLETLKSVNFFEIGSKFLAVQRHSF
jgi:hypothetical protein